MPVLKIKKDGFWEELGGTSPADGGNADTLDGKHASEFASATDVADLQTKVGYTSVSEQIAAAQKTLTMHLSEETMVLSSLQYGNTLPTPGTPGRIFFLRVSE